MQADVWSFINDDAHPSLSLCSRLLLLRRKESETVLDYITEEHLYVNELQHIFSTSLNQLLESSISRFINSIPFTERSTGSLLSTAVAYLLSDDENGLWKLDDGLYFCCTLFAIIHFTRICLSVHNSTVLRCHIVQLRRARVLPTTVREQLPQWSKNTSSNIIAQSLFSLLSFFNVYRWICCVSRRPNSINLYGQYVGYFHIDTGDERESFGKTDWMRQ